MRVHLVQFDIAWEDPVANRARVTALVERAAPAAGDLIVLPETAFTAFSFDIARTLPDARDAEAFLADLARGHRCTIVGGIVAADTRGRASNQSLAFSAEGDLLARYVKIQPFTLGGERKVHAAGGEIVHFSWQGLTVAPFICYDLRFPELFREAVKADAEMFVVIASWPARRTHHWLTLLAARAIENQAVVVGVNRCGTDPGNTYLGHSVVVSPHGHVVADAGEGEHVLTAAIDPDEIRAWRRDFPALLDMRR
jgi:predicted amidohydrolase